MRKTLKDLKRETRPVTAVVHSLDQALYQVTLKIGEEEYLFSENDGRTFRRHSLNEVRDALRAFTLERVVLRQTSAYDEMIGQPPGEGSNALEVPLSLDLYPEITRH